MFGNRLRNMRAAALAAMAKRGFGFDKNAAATSSPLSIAPSRHLHARNDDNMAGGVALGGGLEDFFGFADSSRPLPPGSKTAPMFFQESFRISSKLSRSYSRLVFLSHYRIEVGSKRKKWEEVLSFNEVELIAQILMRCWAMPVDTGVVFKDDTQSPQPSADTANPSLALASMATADPTNPALTSGAGGVITPQHSVSARELNSSVPRGSIATGSGAAVNASNASMFIPPISRMVTDSTPNRLSDDNMSPCCDSSPSSSSSTASHAHSGAAARGYDFLPIVAQMMESDEDNGVGDVLVLEFMNGFSRNTSCSVC
jgi:hypothetical protein